MEKCLYEKSFRQILRLLVHTNNIVIFIDNIVIFKKSIIDKNLNFNLNLC